MKQPFLSSLFDETSHFVEISLRGLLSLFFGHSHELICHDRVLLAEREGRSFALLVFLEIKLEIEVWISYGLEIDTPSKTRM